MVLVDDLDRVLLLWRRRFAQPRWGWELPGGFVDQDELASEAVARELADQAGYRARQARHLITFQHFADAVDGEHVLFMGLGAVRAGDRVRTDGIDRVEWVPLTEVPGLIAAGQIWNGGTLVSLQQVLTQR
jgi:8-oxo-dGDP phosphatase